MDTIQYTWDQVQTDTTKICNWVTEIGFMPDFIVGIVRGGAVPGIIMSHQLNVPVKLAEWSTRDSKVKNAKGFNEFAAMANDGVKILFVEDIIDSGETIAQIKNQMANGNQRNVLFTSLWYNPSQKKTTAHYWANTIDRNFDDRWIIFPWE